MIQRRCQLLILSQCLHQKLLQYSFLGKVALKSMGDIEDEEQEVQGCHIISTPFFLLPVTCLFQIYHKFYVWQSVVFSTQQDLCCTIQKPNISRSFHLHCFNQVTYPISLSDPLILSGSLGLVWLCLLLSATTLVFWRTGVDWATDLQQASGNLFTFSAEDRSCLVFCSLNLAALTQRNSQSITGNWNHPPDPNCRCSNCTWV